MKIGKFIKLVKERPILYDSLHALHKDRKAKEQMWLEVSAAMNLHTDIAKSRWKSLKDCYTKYLKSKMATGPASYLKYGNWQWAQHMEFVKPHIKFGLILSNIELQDNQETDDLVIQSSSDVQDCQSGSELLGTHERCLTSERSETPESSEMPEKFCTFEKTSTHELQDNSKAQERSQTRKRTFEKMKRRRRVTMCSPDINSDKIMSNTFVNYLDNMTTESYSATELIFLGYAKSIKSFTIRRQARIKMKIAKIMMEEEIANLEEIMSNSE